MLVGADRLLLGLQQRAQFLRRHLAGVLHRRVHPTARSSLVWGPRRRTLKRGAKDLHAASQKHNKFSTNLYTHRDSDPLFVNEKGARQTGDVPCCGVLVFSQVKRMALMTMQPLSGHLSSPTLLALPQHTWSVSADPFCWGAAPHVTCEFHNQPTAHDFGMLA